MSKEFVIYADESERRGELFSNFFGGAIVVSTDLAEVVRVLQEAKDRENLFREIKWTKVTENYLEKYKNVISVFFELVQQKKIRVRIMFMDNRHVPFGLTKEQSENEYFMLYYQFIKHAFGLRYANESETPIRCRLLLDELPDTEEKAEGFKDYLAKLRHNKDFRGKIDIDRRQIAQVRSHDHVILQCLDIVLGAMAFRLNRRHLHKPEGQRIRGKRTRAKASLYKHISDQIRSIYPKFNIGETTGKGEEGMKNTWEHPYRHWKFIPKNHRREERK